MAEESKREADPRAFFEEELPARYRETIEGLEQKIAAQEEKVKGAEGEELEKAGRKLQKYKRRMEDAKAADALVRVELTGEGGGKWDLHIAGGELKCGPAGEGDAIVTIQQSVGDWQATASGGVGERFSMFGGGGGGEGGGGGQLGLARFVTKSRMERLGPVQGCIGFKITEMEDGGEWGIKVKIGAGPVPEEPNTSISIKYPDYEELAAGRLPPQAAFMSGKIQIQGDMGIAMQLGSMFMG